MADTMTCLNKQICECHMFFSPQVFGCLPASSAGWCQRDTLTAQVTSPLQRVCGMYEEPGGGQSGNTSVNVFIHLNAALI